MRRKLRFLAACVGTLCMLGFPAQGAADPSDSPDDVHSHADHSGPPELAPFDGPAFAGMTLVGNSDKDGTTNSDLAFWEDLAFAGNYHGFRILDISGPEPQVLSDYYCRGPQNDVSVYRAGGRLLLFQSVDTPQSKESCDGTQAGSSTDQPLDPNYPRQRVPGFEGIRIFDVTDPSDPQFVDGVPTACGSHTHTLIPDQRRRNIYIYVTSYPLTSNITPPGHPEFDGPRCKAPHQKISVIRVPFDDPTDWDRREEKLSDDTAPYPGAQSSDPLRPPFKACHDIQAFMATKTAVAACAGDAQIWDISNPWNPSASGDEPHTHIGSPSSADAFEFIHNAVVTWDGKVFGITDETGGGGTGECDGSPEGQGGESENGFTYFYDMVKPGDPAPALRGRYMIPRPQGTQICVSHNGNVVPVAGRYLMAQAYYQGGNTLVDFTDPSNPTEVAYSDLNDGVGVSDSWSTYWYNDRVYVNGGLNRLGATANRGVDVFTLDDVTTGVNWHHSNPQTQEAFQAP